MRSFKPSRAPWVAEIPADWTEAPLFTYFRESKRKNAGMAETNVLSLSYGEIKRRDVESGFGLLPESFETYQIVEPGNIVMRLTDLQNDQRSLRTGLVTERGIITSAYVALAPAPRVDERFARYLLHALDTMKVFYGLGAGVRQTMNYGDLSGIPLAFPPKLIQGAIADYLDSETVRIDSLIDRKHRFIDLLLEKRAALITHAVTRGLDPMAEVRDSGIEWTGRISISMRVTALKHLLVSIVDTEHKTAPFYEYGDYLVCRTTNVRNGCLRMDGAKFTDLDGYREWTQRAIPLPGDIVFTREAPAGEACLVPDEPVLCLGQRTVLLKVDSRRLDSRYAVYSLYGGPARQYIALLSQGSTVSHFNMADIGTIPLTVPGVDEQSAIADFLDTATRDIDLVIDKTRRSINLLREYRTALISAAVTGQIDIPDASPSEEVA